jgi:hypothetical protein
MEWRESHTIVVLSVERVLSVFILEKKFLQATIHSFIRQWTDGRFTCVILWNIVRQDQSWEVTIMEPKEEFETGHCLFETLITTMVITRQCHFEDSFSKGFIDSFFCPHPIDSNEGIAIRNPNSTIRIAFAILQQEEVEESFQALRFSVQTVLRKVFLFCILLKPGVLESVGRFE